jgi:hypothetical protein
MPIKEVREVGVKKISFNPCAKCGSEDLEILNCGYSSFNVGHVKCKACKHEVKLNLCHWDDSGAYVELAKAWNAWKPRFDKAKVLRS